MYDVIVIGAGISGSTTARELSRYQLKICVVEKAEDVCCGTSKANSGIVHAGYDARAGSLMAKLNVQGNQMMEAASKELDFPFERIGSLVICCAKADIPVLQRLYAQGKANGVQGLEILGKEAVMAMEPNITAEVVAALYAPTAGIVCPFTMNIAYAENAFENGVEFRFHTEVKKIQKVEDLFEIETTKGLLQAKCVVNAAGVYADRIHHMLSAEPMRITPRRGEYLLLDKTAGAHVSKTIFALPGKFGKGVLVTPTTHGNLLVGPTAVDIIDKEGTDTTAEGLARLRKQGGDHVRNIPMEKVITSFAGLRAHEDGHEFMIAAAKDCENLIDCGGIASPGLSSAPAIGKMVAEIVVEKLSPRFNTQFYGRRKGILSPARLSYADRDTLIRENPMYSNIVCRCEMISEGEVVDAIRRSLGATTLDGIKRRVRVGSGRCQAGFCTPKTMEILSRELGVRMEEIKKSGSDAQMILGKNKEWL
ncbi:MAG: NAD(P)/FAD-dependent oxidoreductase [Lachnospiraceae bacterium]|nr:NAD(P)/FAD-dependent oxidoreductase [Lachnospiraceae bacterium]